MLQRHFFVVVSEKLHFPPSNLRDFDSQILRFRDFCNELLAA